MSEELPDINQQNKAVQITNLFPNTIVELEKRKVDNTWSFEKIDSKSIHSTISQDTSNISYSVVELPRIPTISLNNLLDTKEVSKITVRIEKQLSGEFISQLDYKSKKKAIYYILQSNSGKFTETQNSLIQTLLQVFKHNNFTFHSVKHEHSEIARKIYKLDGDEMLQISTMHDYSPIVNKLDQEQSLFNMYVEIELSKPLNEITNLHKTLCKMDIELIRTDRYTKSDFHILTEGLLMLLGIEK